MHQQRLVDIETVASAGKQNRNAVLRNAAIFFGVVGV